MLIPPGEVASYGQIAKQAGLSRRGARMVGPALGAAPQELTVPWHRVVNAQGRIALPPGSNRFELQVKMLRAEGIEVRDGQLDMDKYRWEPTLDEMVWGPGRLHDPREEP